MAETMRENNTYSSGRKFGGIVPGEDTDGLKIQITREDQSNPFIGLSNIQAQKTDEEIEFEKLLEKNRIVHYIDDLNLQSLEKETKKREKAEYDTSEHRQKQIEKDYDFLPKPLSGYLPIKAL